MSNWNELEVVCPCCGKHFFAELSGDRMGIKSYRKILKTSPVKHYKPI